ncbi:MSMEG_1061 family FMN-dependent PPOX-type flavoprotein [Lewinella sp. IMCC34191]|uniref:MSMEG_1061 family FMN-dependent PPOX-type flavoprotein n=1 Tax=Lewinella sp. IMCC34191 TaxID=2259172 RepID=UPI0018E4FBFF|nr:MSMEG_1061 family FMN-dependent PPOX-type flavoprotein [Lewinella sp. IMCC34191]
MPTPPTATDRTFRKPITTEAELRDIMGHPADLVVRKTLNHLDHHCRTFIENSPFLTIGSSDGRGNFDVSPKGDPAGFVRILDDRTIAIPDRPGNRRADTLTNVLQNPTVGLLFFIPGVKETLRINGTARIVRDEEILDLMAINGRRPLFAMIVTVREAFMHCAKCIIRSQLWTVDETRPGRIASLATSLVDQAKLDISVQEMDDMIKEDERTNLY